MTEINIKNIGAVEDFFYTLADYGLHVIHGMQGAGKTTILRTVQLVADGQTDARLSKRDGSPRGEATVAGKTLRIVKQIREDGEFSLEGLPSSFSIADLHSPAFEKATTRDKHRIKTLVQLTGVEADASRFYELLGGEENFKRIVPVDSLTTNDLVEMAARVKRAIEREAIRVEGMEKTVLADSRAQASLYESVDTSKEHRDDVLQSTLEIAIKTSASRAERVNGLKRQLEAARDSIVKADEARARLAAMGAGKTVAEAKKEADLIKVELEQKISDELDIETSLKVAHAHTLEVATRHQAAIEAVKQAKREEALHAELHEAINAAGTVAPAKGEIEEAEAEHVAALHALADAKSSVTQGVRIREALEAQKRSVASGEQAKQLHTEAKRLRDAATDTADVLTAAISSLNDCPLKIKLDEDGEPRLVIATDRSETEPFDELSDGERWLHVVQIAAAANRLIVLPQHAFGELSPESKDQLNKLAKTNRCYILTAVADDCELHGESYK